MVVLLEYLDGGVWSETLVELADNVGHPPPFDPLTTCQVDSLAAYLDGCTYVGHWMH